jgi:hypothetical protein
MMEFLLYFNPGPWVAFHFNMSYSYFIILPCLTPDNFTCQGDSAGQFKGLTYFLHLSMSMGEYW